jgi:DNA polymerase III alpha subunit (gram-positive type)
MLTSSSKSTFPVEADLLEAIMEILNPYIEAERDLVFVGHDFKHDEQYLASLGLRVASLMRQRETIDTQAMHQAWSGRDNGCGLRGVLGDLELESKHLHNAGNDAVYTLRAMIGLSIKPSGDVASTARRSDGEASTEI